MLLLELYGKRTRPLHDSGTANGEIDIEEYDKDADGESGSVSASSFDNVSGKSEAGSSRSDGDRDNDWVILSLK